MLYDLLARCSCCSFFFSRILSFGSSLEQVWTSLFLWCNTKKPKRKHTIMKSRMKKLSFPFKPYIQFDSFVRVFIFTFFFSWLLRGSIFLHKIRVWYLPHFSIIFHLFSLIFQFEFNLQSIHMHSVQCTNTHLVPIGNLNSFVAFVAARTTTAGTKKPMHKFSMWISFH